MPRAAVNTVEVDEAAELAELAAFAERSAAAEVEAQAAAAELELQAAGHDPAAWRAASDFVVNFVAERVCPNWNLGEAERASLSSSLAELLDHYWPGGPGGLDLEKMHPALKLAAAAGAIALTRFDLQTLSLKPMHAPRTDDGTDEATERQSPVPGGDDPIGQERGGFSIGGG